MSPFSDGESVYDIAYCVFLGNRNSRGEGQLLATKAGLLFLDWGDKAGTISLPYSQISQAKKKMAIAPNFCKLRIVSNDRCLDFYIGKKARENFLSIISYKHQHIHNDPVFSEDIYERCFISAAAHFHSLPGNL